MKKKEIIKIIENLEKNELFFTSGEEEGFLKVKEMALKILNDESINIETEISNVKDKISKLTRFVSETIEKKEIRQISNDIIRKRTYTRIPIDLLNNKNNFCEAKNINNTIFYENAILEFLKSYEGGL